MEFGFPLFVIDADVFKAYDCTEFKEIIRGADDAGIPRILTAAWIRELSNMSSRVILSSNSQSDYIKRFRSLLQGDPSAPSLFNLAGRSSGPFCGPLPFQGLGL